MQAWVSEGVRMHTQRMSDGMRRHTQQRTEGGGQSRYQKPYIRSVTLPIDQAGSIAAPLASFASTAVTDLEPIMLAMDWGSNTVAGGEHFHTLPVRLNGGLSMSQRSQFSRSAFMMGAFALNYREYR